MILVLLLPEYSAIIGLPWVGRFYQPHNVTTTQSNPSVDEKPPARRGAGDLTLIAGLLLCPLAFVFGGFATLLALPGVLVARLRGPAFVYFGGAVVCSVLSLAGVNPWASLVREKVLDDLERALGTRPTYAAWDFNAGSGTMRFENIEVALPAIGGDAALVQARFDAGPGFLWNATRPKVEARGLRVSMDGNSDFGAFLKNLEGASSRAIDLQLESIELFVTGPDLQAAVAIASARGSAEPDGFRVDMSVRQVDLTWLDQKHSIVVMGTTGFERRAGLTAVTFDVKLGDSDVMMGYLHGTLGAQEESSALVFTLDALDLGALWARYRKIDVYGGTARGKVRIGGSMDDLHMALDVEISDYSYFHRAVMALDESRAFRLPEARLHGGLRLQNGTSVTLDALTLEVPDGTLCTDPAMSAQGSATLTLDGAISKLSGRLDAVVASGRVRRAISWSPVGTANLQDVQPNIVQVAEQFGDFTLDWNVEVKNLEVACEPLAGMLGGKLSGQLVKEPGRKHARLSVGGKLDLTEGRFALCAAAGEVTGVIEFNPAAPSYEASIRGALKGKVASTDLTAELTGRLSHPGLVFSGITMHPDDLGRMIATSGEQDAAEKARRAEALSRLCGPAAAMNNNPFLAHKGGRVSFTFKP